VSSEPKESKLASKSHVVLSVSTRWGKVRIKVSAGLYHKADARDINGNFRPANSGCRDAICIQVRKALNKSGAYPSFINWRDLEIEVVAHLNKDEEYDENLGVLTPHDAYLMRVASNLRKALDEHNEKQEAKGQMTLFDSDEFVTPTSSDEICGCVPFPVTKK
jgi:hypothetical protein